GYLFYFFPLPLNGMMLVTMAIFGKETLRKSCERNLNSSINTSALIDLKTRTTQLFLPRSSRFMRLKKWGQT
ncbi:MAG: hypothetical protein WBG61_15670, partial [Desulfobacterales bacterium]